MPGGSEVHFDTGNDFIRNRVALTTLLDEPFDKNEEADTLASNKVKVCITQQSSDTVG